jgi:teichuronic acid exporter
MSHGKIPEPNEGTGPAPAPPTAQEYGARAKRGLMQMIARQAAVHVLTFAGGIVLARTLTPEIFGVFAIATFFVGAISLLGNLGIAPALVQRKEELTERDLQVAFTLQTAMLTAVAAIVWVAAPWFLRLYPDVGGDEVVWLIRVLAVLIFVQPWRSISILQMERHLNFSRVAVIEVVEALSYQAIAVTLAVTGHGIWSLVWATLARAVLGATLAFGCHPWRVRLAWNWRTTCTLLRYGVPFQAGAIVTQAGTWITPLIVGPMIGASAVGFLNWADSIGRKPAKSMQSVTRVSFPHFSRLQDNSQELKATY